MNSVFNHAIKNLKRKKLRTSLIILGIAIGVASVVIITTIGEIGKAAIHNELNSLGLGSLTVSTDSNKIKVELYPKDIDLIESLDCTDSAVPIMFEYTNFKMRQEQNNTIVWGIDAGAKQIISLDVKHGRLINKSDVLSSTNVCLIDESMAKNLYNRTNVIGKKIEIKLGGDYQTFDIVGVVNSGGSMLQNLMVSYVPSFIYLPYTSMQRQSGRSCFNSIAVKVKDNSDVDRAGEIIASVLENTTGAKGAYKVENVTKQKAQLDNLLQIVTLILTLIAGISLIVAGLGIMTIMLVSVNERTREIGIKKSIGASKLIIRLEFMIEAFTISFIGSIIGTVLGIAIAYLGAMPFGLEVIINYQIIIFSILFSVIIGIIFGVYPATKAANLRPADALRYE